VSAAGNRTQPTSRVRGEENGRPEGQTVRHRRLRGGIRLQAIRSSMPWERGPHAAVCASRKASVSLAAEAVPLARAPLKETATVHSACWELNVDQRRKAVKARTSSSVASFPRGVMETPCQEPCIGPPCCGESAIRRTDPIRKECMRCEEVLLRLWEYLDEELAREEAEAVAAHLEHCGGCHPAYCWDRALLQLLARQRLTCSAPAGLVISLRVRLPESGV
jgi:Putative zinc-finger